MNRSILIVICDFLLVSLLAFSTVDINKVAETGAPRQLNMQIATNQVDTSKDKDLAAVMRLALDEERKNREQLLGELVRSRETIGEREKNAQTLQQQTQTLQQQLQTKEQETTRLQRAQAELQANFAAAQTNIQNLSQRVQSSSAEALLSREKLAAMESLWEDLSRSPENIESPEWHKDVLDQRQRRVADGTDPLN